jgi:hypothetical protein
MYKIGTGLGKSAAGKVYYQGRVKKEGNQNWVYLKGKLYLRREADPLDTVTVINALDLTVEGEIRLDLLDFFEGNKDMERQNLQVPLLTDGENLAIPLFTVQSRERYLKP